jgi:hypothetical protein
MKDPLAQPSQHHVHFVKVYPPKQVNLTTTPSSEVVSIYTGAAVNGAAKPSTELETTKASGIKMRAVSWFWPGRFALGKFAVIGGLPDKGKGLISADIITRCTKGSEWPCREGTAPSGSAIWFTAEDDIEDTVVPRLVAAGADLDKVHIVGLTKNRDGSRRTFNLTTDLPILEQKIKEIGDVVLVIVDPISAYVGVGKLNNSSTTDVRGMLAPLTRLAEEKKISIIGIMHFNKKSDVTNAMLRIADSLAYVAAARHVYFVVDDPENEKARLFVKAKNNLAPDKHALRFMVGTRMVGHDPDTQAEIRAPHVEWDGKHVEVTATEAMEAEAGGGSRAARREAEDFLRLKLAPGPVPQADLRDEAEANDISYSTLKRAKRELRVVAKKVGELGAGKWLWELPTVANRHHDDL